MLPVLLSNHLAGILQPPSLVDSGPCQASKMESFVRVVIRINYSRWKPIVFYEGGFRTLVSIRSDEIWILGPYLPKS